MDLISNLQNVHFTFSFGTVVKPVNLTHQTQDGRCHLALPTSIEELSKSIAGVKLADGRVVFYISKPDYSFDSWQDMANFIYADSQTSGVTAANNIDLEKIMFIRDKPKKNVALLNDFLNACGLVDFTVHKLKKRRNRNDSFLVEYRKKRSVNVWSFYVYSDMSNPHFLGQILNGLRDRHYNDQVEVTNNNLCLIPQPCYADETGFKIFMRNSVSSDVGIKQRFDNIGHVYRMLYPKINWFYANLLFEVFNEFIESNEQKVLELKNNLIDLIQNDLLSTKDLETALSDKIRRGFATMSPILFNLLLNKKFELTDWELSCTTTHDFWNMEIEKFSSIKDVEEVLENNLYYSSQVFDIRETFESVRQLLREHLLARVHFKKEQNNQLIAKWRQDMSNKMRESA